MYHSFDFVVRDKSCSLKVFSIINSLILLAYSDFIQFLCEENSTIMAPPSRRAYYEIALRCLQEQCEGSGLKELPLPALLGYLQKTEDYYSGFVTAHCEEIANLTDEEQLNDQEFIGIDVGLVYQNVHKCLSMRIFELGPSITKQTVQMSTQVQVYFEELLLALPKIQKSTASELRHLKDGIQNIQTQFRQLNVPIEQDNQEFAIFAIVHSMDDSTAQVWQSRRDHRIPTLDTMRDFLEKRAQKIDRTANVRANMDRVAETSQNKRLPPCVQCQESHPLFRCPRFLGLNVLKRRCRVGKLNVCRNCLHSGHEAVDCEFGPCKVCPNEVKHNSLLCFKSKAKAKLLRKDGNAKSASGRRSASKSIKSKSNMKRAESKSLQPARDRKMRS